MENELLRLNKKYQGNEVALAVFEGFKTGGDKGEGEYLPLNSPV